MLTLCGFPLSNYYNKVKLALLEKGADFVEEDVGTGKKDENGKVTPFEVKVGDKVLISKYGGTEVKIDDQKYTLVREDDILGVIV